MTGVNPRTLLSAGATWIPIVSLMRYVFYLCWRPYWLGSQYHTRESQVTFDTKQGQEITAGLNQLFVDYDLNFTFGTAPHDYSISRSAFQIMSQWKYSCFGHYRAPYPSNDSQLSLFAELVCGFRWRIQYRTQILLGYAVCDIRQQQSCRHPQLPPHQHRGATFRHLCRTIHQERPVYHWAIY